MPMLLSEKSLRGVGGALMTLNRKGLENSSLAPCQSPRLNRVQMVKRLRRGNSWNVAQEVPGDRHKPIGDHDVGHAHESDSHGPAHGDERQWSAKAGMVVQINKTNRANPSRMR